MGDSSNYATDEVSMSIYYRALGYAECAHRQQKRKYTGEPYINHCRNVAELVQDVLGKEAQHTASAAALHDAVEDTPITLDEIEAAFGPTVAQLVAEVTDVSRPEDGNREKRKQIDREHIAKSSPEGATIKLADLIDNTSTIVKYDLGFAKIYLKEKALLLPLLKHGNPKLWTVANRTLTEALKSVANQ